MNHEYKMQQSRYVLYLTKPGHQSQIQRATSLQAKQHDLNVFFCSKETEGCGASILRESLLG